MMRRRKSQVSLFILLGMIIFIIFGFMFFAVKVVSVAQIEKEVDKVHSDFLRVTALGYYVDKCLKQVTQEGLYHVANQGGYIYPDQADDSLIKPISWKGPDMTSERRFNFTFIIQPLPLDPPGKFPVAPIYPCLNSDFVNDWPYCRYVHDIHPFNTMKYLYGVDKLMPLCQDAESCGDEVLLSVPPGSDGVSTQYHLQRYIEHNLATCVDIESILPAAGGFAGFNVTKGNVSASINFGDDDLIVNVTFPVEFTQKGNEPVVRESTYATQENIRWKQIYKCARDVVRYENRKLLFNLIGGPILLPGCGGNFNVKYDVNVLPGVDAIRIIDSQSVLFSDDYTVTLGMKNRNPVLDYTAYAPSPEVDMHVMEGGTLFIDPFAYDPDDADNPDLVYNYSGNSIITTQELQSSQMFNDTLRATAYNTTHEDVGYHNITLRVKDPHDLIDYQIIRILVDDILKVMLHGFSPFDDIDPRIASIEDPYVVMINEESPDIFNAGDERQYIWMDYEEYPEGEEVFHESYSDTYPELILPGNDGDYVPDVKNVMFTHFSPCSYYQHLNIGHISVFDHPDTGCQDVSDLLSTITTFIPVAPHHYMVPHHISLEVNVTPKATADWTVNVTQCLPHRTGVLMSAYPDPIPIYPFSDYHGDSYPDVDPTAAFSDFLGNHTCCSDGTESNSNGWGTVLPASTECYRFDEFFCGGPVVRNEDGDGVVGALFPTLPNLNDDNGGILLGNEVTPQLVGELGLPMTPTLALENDIFHRVFTVDCNGERGNICNGSTADNYVRNMSCLDYEDDEVQRCKGCGVFGTRIEYDPFEGLHCKKFSYDTFERLSGLPDKIGESDFTKYHITSPGYDNTIPLCNPKWKCSTSSQYNEVGPYRAQSVCYEGECNDRPVNLFCEANGHIPGALSVYDAISGGCGEADLACDNMYKGFLPKLSQSCGNGNKPYFLDYCDGSCNANDQPTKFVCKSEQFPDGTGGGFINCDCGNNNVDNKCHGVSVSNPIIPSCGLDPPWFPDKCKETNTGSLQIVDSFVQFDVGCEAECNSPDNPFSCISLITAACAIGEDAPCDGVNLNSPAALCGLLNSANECADCIEGAGLGDTGTVCQQCQIGCCVGSFTEGGDLCWTKSVASATYNNPPAAVKNNGGGVGCHANPTPESPSTLHPDDPNDHLCHGFPPGSAYEGRKRGCEDDCTSVKCEPYSFLTKSEVNSAYIGEYFSSLLPIPLGYDTGDSRCIIQSDLDAVYDPVMSDPDLNANVDGNSEFCAVGYDIDIAGLRDNTASKTYCVKCTNNIQGVTSGVTGASGVGKCESGGDITGATLNDDCNAHLPCDEKDPKQYVFSGVSTKFCGSDCKVCPSSKEVVWYSDTNKNCGCAAPPPGVPSYACDSDIDGTPDGTCVKYLGSNYNCDSIIDEGVIEDGRRCTHVSDDVRICDTDVSTSLASLDGFQSNGVLTGVGVCVNDDLGDDKYDSCDTEEHTKDFCLSGDSLTYLVNCDPGDVCEDDAAYANSLDLTGVVFSQGSNNHCCRQLGFALFDSVTDDEMYACYESSCNLATDSNCDQDVDDELKVCGWILDGEVEYKRGISYITEDDSLGCCGLIGNKVLVADGDGWKCVNENQVDDEIDDDDGSGCYSNAEMTGLGSIYVSANALNSGWESPCLDGKDVGQVLPNELIVNTFGSFSQIEIQFLDSGDVSVLESDIRVVVNGCSLSGVVGNTLYPDSDSEAYPKSFSGSCHNPQFKIRNNNPNSDFKYKVVLQVS
mgnify:FL=1